MLAEPVRHRFTVEQFHHMGDTDLFPPDQRLELLGGEAIEMAPIGSRHAAAVNRLSRLFIQALGDQAIVAVQNPVRLGDISEPQPDIVIARSRPDFYEAGHPTPDDVLLLVEVSDSTIAWDRRVKRPFYAAAGIMELWIVDLAAQLAEVATEPGADDYRNILQIQRGGTIAPVLLPQLVIAVADILG